MNTGAGDRRVGDLLLHGLEGAPRLNQTSIADVSEYAYVLAARDLGEVQHLLVGYARRVLSSASDAEGAVIEPRLQHRHEPVVELRRNGLTDELVKLGIQVHRIGDVPGDPGIGQIAAVLQ